MVSSGSARGSPPRSGRSVSCRRVRPERCPSRAGDDLRGLDGGDRRPGGASRAAAVHRGLRDIGAPAAPVPLRRRIQRRLPSGDSSLPALALYEDGLAIFSRRERRWDCQEGLSCNLWYDDVNRSVNERRDDELLYSDRPVPAAGQGRRGLQRPRRLRPRPRLRGTRRYRARGQHGDRPALPARLDRRAHPAPAPAPAPAHARSRAPSRRTRSTLRHGAPPSWRRRVAHQLATAVRPALALSREMGASVLLKAKYATDVWTTERSG
jgi:hypothetical protein